MSDRLLVGPNDICFSNQMMPKRRGTQTRNKINETDKTLFLNNEWSV